MNALRGQVRSSTKSLSGHLKTGQRWSPQNRPMGMARAFRIFVGRFWVTAEVSNGEAYDLAYGFS